MEFNKKILSANELLKLELSRLKEECKMASRYAMLAGQIATDNSLQTDEESRVKALVKNAVSKSIKSPSFLTEPAPTSDIQDLSNSSQCNVFTDNPMLYPHLLRISYDLCLETNQSFIEKFLQLNRFANFNLEEYKSTLKHELAHFIAAIDVKASPILGVFFTCNNSELSFVPFVQHDDISFVDEICIATAPGEVFRSSTDTPFYTAARLLRINGINVDSYVGPIFTST